MTQGSPAPPEPARGVPGAPRAEGPGLFDGVLARGPVREAVSDRALLQAMLDAEAALARANAAAGVVTTDDADAVAAVCDAARFDPAALGQAAAASGNPVVPLVRALSGEAGPAARAVHVGATSQDILDSAWMLVIRRAAAALLEDLDAAAGACAALAEQHRDTVLAGRTLLQHALPTTFGLKAAGWLVGLDAAGERLRAVVATRLAAQLGGAAGTLASLGDAGLSVAAHYAAELGLAEPTLPWHTERTRIVDVAGAAAAVAAATGKPARDLVLLAQTEVGETRERSDGGQGGSSTLPHKRNPVAAVSAAACAARAPGLVAALCTAATQHEHERAAGAWHAEWAPLRDLLVAVGSAASWLREALGRLEVDVDAMRTTLGRTGDALLAERVAAALAPALGRQRAHDVVRAATLEALDSGRSLHATLAEVDEAARHLDEQVLDELLDPARYLGSAHAFVDRAVQAHRRRAP